jgi:Rrf2 family iron-sulfur cluster assembly transcriptional regulator
MRVTKWGECGILCAIYLGLKHGERTIGAAEIAESQGLDMQYTQQVLQRLRKGGIIESERGPKGGYRLQREAKDITLKDILYAAEGDTFQIMCSTRENCSLHGVWQELRVAIDKLLEQKTLDQLLSNPNHDNSFVQLNTERVKSGAV